MYQLQFDVSDETCEIRTHASSYLNVSFTTVNHSMYLLFHSSFWKLSVLVLTFSRPYLYLSCCFFRDRKIWIQTTLMSFMQVPYSGIAPRIMSWHFILADLGKQIPFKLLITRNSCYHYLIKILIKYFMFVSQWFLLLYHYFLSSLVWYRKFTIHKELADQWVPYLWCHSCTTWH